MRAPQSAAATLHLIMVLALTALLLAVKGRNAGQAIQEASEHSRPAEKISPAKLGVRFVLEDLALAGWAVDAKTSLIHKELVAGAHVVELVMIGGQFGDDVVMRCKGVGRRRTACDRMLQRVVEWSAALGQSRPSSGKDST
ncbi:hypothetical protein NA57DRAFT_54495 [Rhizodiscina lignyota]|uniref:Uncharacterized protein n=1 Tax=Rhizodiscina lignyota TaxID=1504668 RepID=A0A9P4M7V4_9PEZI|nr:hypothetical protein NA57DRAFT_54495 [Rhizodiscina lignyota]